MKNQKGITLVALIITIIVMLILVGVTINVALNGGLFKKAKEAVIKTEVQQIEEQLMIKKASLLTDSEIDGTTGYNITIDDLDISAELKNKYRNKLSISSDGKLQYNANNCTEEEKACLSDLGVKSGTTGGQNTDPQEFSWDSVYLGGVNTESPYQFSGFEITFSDDGIAQITYGGQEIDTVDVKENTSNYITNDHKFTYESDTFGTVIMTLTSNGFIDCYVSGTGTANIPEGTYTYIVDTYVYYNYDGQHSTSKWYIAGVNDGKMMIVNTEAIGNVNLPKTDTVAEAVAEWNNIPSKINSALGVVTESSLKYAVMSNLEYSTTPETIGGYTVYVSDKPDWAVYSPSVKTRLSGTFLAQFIKYGDEVNLWAGNGIDAYSTMEYINFNTNEITELNVGIQAVVILNSGVNINKASGNGTYSSPYGLSNS